MKNDKTTSAAKTMKWVGLAIGGCFLLAGVVSLMLQTEDPTVKDSAIRFAELGLIGLSMVIIGLGFESVLSALARIEEKTSDESEDDDTDILA